EGLARRLDRGLLGLDRRRERVALGLLLGGRRAVVDLGLQLRVARARLLELLLGRRQRLALLGDEGLLALADRLPELLDDGLRLQAPRDPRAQRVVERQVAVLRLLRVRGLRVRGLRVLGLLGHAALRILRVRAGLRGVDVARLPVLVLRAAGAFRLAVLRGLPAFLRRLLAVLRRRSTRAVLTRAVLLLLAVARVAAGSRLLEPPVAVRLVELVDLGVGDRDVLQRLLEPGRVERVERQRRDIEDHAVRRQVAELLALLGVEPFDPRLQLLVADPLLLELLLERLLVEHRDLERQLLVLRIVEQLRHRGVVQRVGDEAVDAQERPDAQRLGERLQIGRASCRGRG